MDIGVVGISYKEASAEIRTAVAFTQSKKIEALNDLSCIEGIVEVLILSTCNRSEIYFVSKDCEHIGKEVRDYFIDFFQVQELESLMYCKTKETAIKHLLTVAAGLDSLILGEDQILGQVKEAYEFAKQLGTSGKILNQTMIKAIAFAKKTKAEFKISENPLSISSVVSRYAKELLGDLSTRRILMIGAGKVNLLCLSYLEALGARDITLCNRTQCTFQETFEEAVIPKVAITLIPYEERYTCIPDMDLVICATSSPHTIIRKELLPSLYKPIVFFDLAMPLDIDSRISECDNVKLLNIDAFQQQTEINLQMRKELSKKIAVDIELKAEEILQWIHQTKVDPLIASFKELCLDTKKDTMDIIQRRMNLSEKEYDFIEKMIESSLNRVIKEPIRQLKQLKSDEDITHYQKAIHYLFDL
jgi:glutamyl-tRNA reductase